MRKKSKTVFIGGTPYDIGAVGVIYGQKRKGLTIFGQFRPKSYQIKFLNRLGRDKNTTIIHEILHAIDHQYSMDMSELMVDILSREISGALGQIGVLK